MECTFGKYTLHIVQLNLNELSNSKFFNNRSPSDESKLYIFNRMIGNFDISFPHLLCQEQKKIELLFTISKTTISYSNNIIDYDINYEICSVKQLKEEKLEILVKPPCLAFFVL